MPPLRFAPYLVAVIAVAALSLAGTPLAAQEDPAVGGAERSGTGDVAGDWDTARVLELVDRARRVRQEQAVDSAMFSYAADARGFVYFFLDRTDNGERTLVKADQVALDVWWRAPNDARQRIKGLRDEKVLPTNIKYHLDHLTVVQDEFGDLIRLGDGDEVEAVLHPAAPGSGDTYRYRLADSLNLSFMGGAEPITVYEVEVLPRQLDEPGFVGTLFLARESGGIVRMNFSFTPASYVDPYLDYIRISLENGLWMGRFWLPYRQEAELRRELPALDFLAGSVIRGRFEVGDYRFNLELPNNLFMGRGVLAVPERGRRAFEFEEPLYAGLEDGGLATSDEMKEIRDQVETLVRDQALSGLAPARLYWSSVSQGIRYNRAEGVYVGAGTSLRLPAGMRARIHAGWGLARDDGSARITFAPDAAEAATELELEWETLQDIGPMTPASGVVNSLAALGGRDYLDPWFRTGARLSHRIGPSDGLHGRLGLGWARHRSARLAVDGDGNTAFRPVRPVAEGIVRSVEAALVLPGGATGWRGSLALTGADLDAAQWARVDVHAGWDRQTQWHALDLSAEVRAGFNLGDGPPPQDLYLLGGRATLPGHTHRSLVGERYWLAQGRVGQAVATPWFGVHVGAAAGQAILDAPLPDGWAGRTDAGVLGSAWVGVDALWDVLTIDVARGLGSGGDWAVIFSVAPRFHPWL